MSCTWNTSNVSWLALVVLLAGCVEPTASERISERAVDWPSYGMSTEAMENHKLLHASVHLVDSQRDLAWAEALNEEIDNTSTRPCDASISFMSGLERLTPSQAETAVDSCVDAALKEAQAVISGLEPDEVEAEFDRRSASASRLAANISVVLSEISGNLAFVSDYALVAFMMMRAISTEGQIEMAGAVMDDVRDDRPLFAMHNLISADHRLRILWVISTAGANIADSDEKCGPADDIWMALDDLHQRTAALINAKAPPHPDDGSLMASQFYNLLAPQTEVAKDRNWWPLAIWHSLRMEWVAIYYSHLGVVTLPDRPQAMELLKAHEEVVQDGMISYHAGLVRTDVQTGYDWDLTFHRALSVFAFTSLSAPLAKVQCISE